MPAFRRICEPQFTGSAAESALRLRLYFLSFRCQRVGNLPPVEAAVLNEDLVGARAGHDHPGQINARHIALQRLRIADGQPVRPFEAHAQPLQKVEVGMVAGHGEDKVVGDGVAALGSFEQRRCPA